MQTATIEQMRRKVQELAGLTGRRSVASRRHAMAWLSHGRVLRTKPSREARQVNRFPLIERRISWEDCLDGLRSHGHPDPPKSACIRCPFHANSLWQSMRGQ
ncbi:hypothetical protein QN219_22800 [Sinorhizobium sp. 7-81]|uniref:hypothetical protein n=1 Tax=Sinorhizobium sp. 8-89 TaxID=3049089 RepID=UPI0024C24BD3|nr:hypothetical protein [Sinorhizobium sp. 8-89]MDK1492856.1 hypothetical protein [Sinorhizobium sp. 8-89]